MSALERVREGSDGFNIKLRSDGFNIKLRSDGVNIKLTVNVWLDATIKLTPATRPLARLTFRAAALVWR